VSTGICASAASSSTLYHCAWLGSDALQDPLCLSTPHNVISNVESESTPGEPQIFRFRCRSRVSHEDTKTRSGEAQMVDAQAQ
jgi:hypothetical protein